MFSQPPSPQDLPQAQSATDSLFALSLDLLCLVETTGYFKQVNPAFERTLGWTPAELLARPFTDLVHPDDRGATEAAFQALISGGTPQIVENRYRRKDGTYRWLSWRATTPDERGLFYSIARDVTDQRAVDAERRLRAALLDAVGQAVIATDPAGTITYWNHAAEVLYGWRAAEAVGRSVIDVTPADQSREQAETIMACLRRGQKWSGEFVVRRRDGTSFRAFVTNTPVLDEGGRLTGIVGVSVDVSEVRRVGEALHASEERYRRLVETAHEGICTVDAAGRIEYANARLAGMLGFGGAPLEGRTLFEFMTTADAFVARSRFARRQLGIPEADEIALRREDGRSIWVRQSASSLFDSEGAFSGAVYVMSDVTERVEAQRRLEANERLFRALAEHSAELVSVIDVAGVIRYANPAYIRVLGYTPEEAQGLSALDLIHPDDLPTVADAFAAVAREPGTLVHTEYRARRKDGVWRTLNTTAQNLVHEPAVAGIVVNSRDVTERQDAEDQLRRQTQLLQVIFDHIPAMITLTDAAGGPAFANREWDRVSGWTLEDARHLDLFADLYPDAETRARVVAFMREGSGRAEDFRMRVRDGRILDTVWSSVVLSDGSVVGMGQDVTERRRLEEQLRQAQKMEAVGRLAGGVAHDFNNLIQVITGSTLFAREKLPPDSPARAALADIDAAAGRGAALTRQLLAFGRRQVLRPESLDVNRVVADVERMLRRVIGADVALVTDLDAAAPKVHADAGQLEQVLLNLAVNARDAMPAGGRLTIETRSLQLDAGAAHRHDNLEPGSYVALRVRDTGVGMDDATRSRLFEPFFTTKEPGRGTGLGLATVYGIVTQSGGRVLVETAAGAGSTFTILLPAFEGASSAAPPSPTAPATGGSETILLVEDDATVRAAVRRMLERGGYAVLEAGRLADALRVLDESRRRIALVLTDVVLPDAGATALVPRIRERHADVRVLLMSGYGGEHVSRQVSAAAHVGVLAKPFAPDELLSRVRDVLDAPARR